MDDFDFGEFLGDIESGLDLSGGDTSWLDTVDWGSMIENMDFSNLDLSGVIGDISSGGLDGIIGNFAEDVEEQAGGYYGNMPGRAVYDPARDITELYDPKTDTLREIVHSTRAEDFGIMPDFDESEFTRDIYEPAEQGDIVITGPKPQDEFEEDLAADFWKNLIGPKDDIGTIEIVGKRPDDILTDEEHTRQFEDTTEEDLKDKFWRELENKNENISSILTDEEHVRTKGEDTTEEDLKDKFWKELITKTDTKTDTKTVIDKVKDVITKITDDGKNTALLTALLGGLMGLLNRPSGTAPAGYKGTIPKYIATRGPSRSPTEGGRAPGAAGIGSLTGGVTYTKAAGGGLMGLAAGGSARPARYLRGGTDGMADKIQTDIDGKQPARLSHGEFVIPADVVSHLGNGNSDAGADVLYDMMSKVRKARTGTPKQGRQINPHKYTPV